MFSTPQPVAALSDPGDDEEPTFTADLLEMYFVSTRGGARDIWKSTRTAASDPWGAPVLVPELSSAQQEFTPGISGDGLTIWLDYNDIDDGMSADIWMSSRASRASAWAIPVRVPELNSAVQDVSPAVDPSGLRMVISRSFPNIDLMMTSRPTTASPWLTPVAISEINTTFEDSSGRFARGGLELWFNSNRTGTAGFNDIWRATRPTTSDPFGPPELVMELSSTDQDWDVWLSEDTRYLMLGSCRTGQCDIYEAFR